MKLIFFCPHHFKTPLKNEFHKLNYHITSIEEDITRVERKRNMYIFFIFKKIIKFVKFFFYDCFKVTWTKKSLHLSNVPGKNKMGNF